MYFFVTDETNVEKSKDSKFFIYGGLIFSQAQLADVSRSIEEIRGEYGFQDFDQLKFDTNCRPKHISIEGYKNAKNAVIEACAKFNVKLVVYIVHHSIANKEKRTEFAINSVLKPFGERFLVDNDDVGVVIIDRVPDESGAYSVLKSRFQAGLEMPDGPARKLSRILMYATTCDGASHVSSAVDIVLGAFRFVVNSESRSGASEVPQRLLNNIVGMFYTSGEGAGKTARNYGLIVRPVMSEIRHQPYKVEYEDLLKYLSSLIAVD